MPFHFTYHKLTKEGLCEAFHKYFGIEMKDGLLQLDNEIGKVTMQYLNLPGDIEIIFMEYNYRQEILFNMLPSKLEHYTFVIDCANTTIQQYNVNDEEILKTESQKNNAYLMNSIFPYGLLRKAGAYGKSLVVFIPPYLLDGFTNENDEVGLLGKFYSLQNKGQSFMQLSTTEIKKIESLFYQWEKHKNILSITKYTYQLVEWYFTKLIYFFDNNDNAHKLMPTEAQDLFSLQSHILNNLHESQLDLISLQNDFSTPINKLKQLFEKVYNLSIHEYFKTSKLKKAVELLLSTEKKVAEIAYEFGYANPSNFSDSFRRYYSLTPNEYRHKYKTNIE